MILSAKNILKSFGSLQVLKGIDFYAEKAEIVSIMGASGAGKSTLLQILGTLMKADSGSIEIDNILLSSLSSNQLSDFRAHKLGFVFQSHHLLPEFSALENVMIPAMIAGDNKKVATMKAEKILELVGLGSRLNHKPSELSGGEGQRVAIARALVNNPSVIFADEPTGNLDSATKLEIQKLLFELRSELKQTIIIVTHDAELAKECDRNLLMKDGLFV